MNNTDIGKENNERVNHPEYYRHPSGIECIDIARHHCFSIGNAIKYLWRNGLKTEKGIDNVDKQIEDLEKAKWYIDDRIRELTTTRKIKNEKIYAERDRISSCRS